MFVIQFVSKRMKKQTLLFTAMLAAAFTANAQSKPQDTEFYEPVPKVVTPGKTVGEAPSDAIVLFDGKNLDQWTMTNDRGTPAKWTFANGVFTVNKASGNFETVNAFTNCQLHIEWQVPANI